MSFKTLNIGTTALMSSQLALNTTGHNIANASTPGYTRQRAMTEAALPDVRSFGVVGSGAKIRTIARVADEFLEKQVREAQSKVSYLTTTLDGYENIQAVFNELSENDLSSDMDRFWSALSDVTNHVEDVSTRRAMIHEAEVLADTFNNLDENLRSMRARTDENVVDTVSQVNTLLKQIAELNQDVVRGEKGGVGDVVANDSRDQRTQRLKELSELLDVTVVEEDNGQKIVSHKGRLLVFENQYYELATEDEQSGDLRVNSVVFKKDGEELDITDGELSAFVHLRDVVLPSFKDDLDRLAGQFSWEFNRLHSQGQGLEGFQSITSENSVVDPMEYLDDLTYEFTPLSGTHEIENGNLELKIRNEVTGEVATKNLEIDLDNTGGPDTILYHTNGVDQYDTLSNYQLTGLDFGTDTGPEGQLYIDVVDTGPGGIDVNFYRDSGMLPGDLVATGNLGAPATQGTITVTDGGSGSGIAGTVDLDYTADDNTIVKADIFDNSLVNKMQNALDSFLDNTFEVSVDGANHVTIESKSSNYTIGFGRDTSGALAALGLNTFFGGYDGGTVHVLDRIKNNPDQFAAAQTFVDGDNSNVADLMRLRETGILNNDTATTDDYYQGIVGRMGIEFDQTDNLLETHEDILVRVENQREDLSGVNLDEELAMMIQYQRTFQGAARFISTANTIYESLINM